MALLVAPLLALAALQAAPVQEAPDPEAGPRGREEYLGRTVARTMHWMGAKWLVRKTREDEENGVLLRKWLDVQPGDRVCDLGCGNGYHTLPLARTVGADGRVYAVDLQPEMLDFLRMRAKEEELENMTLVEATISDPKLPETSCDLVLMVDVYHELSHPVTVMRRVRESLRPGGRVVLVEFRAEDRKIPIKPLHKMTKAQVVREMASHGFVLESETDDLPWQHVMAFERGPEDDDLLEPRALAQGFVDALAGRDARIVEPYLARTVELGRDGPATRKSIAVGLSESMRTREGRVAAGSVGEVSARPDGDVVAALLAPEGGDLPADRDEVLLRRDEAGRWSIVAWR
ncbi:MAG: class I SAM-dependent methyltransferase [Planctomycetota bacterium]